MTIWIGRAVKGGLNLAVICLVGWIAHRWYAIIPSALHGAVFTGGSVIAAVLVAFSMQVFSKFDKLLQDFERYGVGQIGSIYTYVGAARQRLVWWMFAAVVGIIAEAGTAYLLKEQSLPDKHWAIVAGYVALSAVMLAAVRVISAYVRVDRFRLELFRELENERLREQTLQAMRRGSLIHDFRHERKRSRAGPRAASK